jgi:ATP/maltotriose-dependent transcriptional regulator MalT
MRALGRQDDTGDPDAAGTPPAAGLVQRTPLLDLLDRAPPQALLWVTAPPGAGKSALAATWAEARRRPADGAAVLWYAVEETDADPLRLFATLGGFLGLAHGFGADIPPEPTPEAFAEIAGAVRRWLDAAPPGRPASPRLIVFDDIHLMPPEAVTIALLPVLAAALPPADRILCLSRLDPPDPAAVPALIMDLRVTADEYPDFARDLPGGRALPQELFLAGLRRAGGWMPGVLAALSPALLQAGMAGGNSAADRRVLLATAFLQEGGAAEWAELGGAEAPALLDRLAGAGGMVSRLPDGGFRKQDALQAALEQAAGAELPTPALNRARIGAARLLGRRGDVLPAARLLLAAGAGDEALELVLDQAPVLSLAGRNRELRDAIELFPAEIVARPRLRIWLAYARMPYEPREAQRALAEIRRSLAPETAPLDYAMALSGEARAVLSDFFDFRELPGLIEQIDAVLPRLGDALPPANRQTLVATRCMAILIGWPDHPGAEEARRWIETALPFLPPTVQLLLGGVQVNHLIWWRGDLAAARPFLSRLEGLARQRGMAPLAVMTWYYAALSEAYLDGDDAALRRLTDEVVAFAGDRGVSHRLTNAFWVVVQAAAAAGDRAAAESMLQRYAACAQQRWRRTDFIGLHHLRAILALCAGDMTAAIAEGGQALDYARRHGGPHQIAAQSQLLATAHAMAGDEAARPHVEALRQVAARTGNATFLLHADLAEAFLASALGGDVAGPWNRVAEAAGRLGFRRIAGMNRPALARLADRALAGGAEAEATRRVIALWELPPPEGAHALWPFPVEIRALGGFAVQVDGARVAMGTGKAQRKPMELLWCLIAGPAEGWAQEELADLLWPELDGDRAIPALRSTIYRLRKLIGARAIRHEDDRLGLAPGQVRTDVARLRATLAAVQDPAADMAARLAAFDLAIGLVRGPLLPGIRLPPVAEARDRLHALLAAAGTELLLAQDPADPATALRAGRLRAAVPGLRLPPLLAGLVPE